MSIKNSKSIFESEVSKLSNSAARARLAKLFDGGCYTEVDRFLKNNDTECEVVAAFGDVNGFPVYAYAQSIDINKGAMGKVQASKIAHVYDMALKTGAPVVAIFDSCGAHVDEGVEALEAYGSLIKYAGNLSGVVPQIAIVAGPCIGSAAVLASLSDFVIMTDKAEFYITSPAFADSSKTQLGKPSLAAKNGTAALVTNSDDEAIEKAAEILSYMPSNNLCETPVTEYIAASYHEGFFSVIDDDSFFELSAEYGPAIKTGFARLGGVCVGIVSNVPDVNEGYFCADSAKKAAKFVRLCDSFSIPVITFVDSLGVLAKEECDLAGEVKAISILTSAYSEATTAKIVLVTGNAVAGAYIAFVSSAASPDMVFAWPEAVIGALPKQTAVQLLYKDRMVAGEKRSELEQEYATQKCSPFVAAASGLVNDIISPEETAAKVISALEVLSSKRVSTISKKHNNLPL